MSDTSEAPNEKPSALTARTDRPLGTSGPARATKAGLYGFLGGLVAGLAVAAVVLGAVATQWEFLRAKLAPPSDRPVISALDQRVATLEAAAGRTPVQDPEIGRLAQRTQALEQAQRAAAEDPRVPALVEKTDQLAAQIAQMRSSAGDQADLQDLVKRAEAAAVAANDVAGKRQSAEALLVVVGQLRDAVERGGPYLIELGAARAVAPADAGPALDALAATAETGVADRQAIIESFPPVAAAIVSAALLPPESEGFWEKLERKAARLVSIRRTDGQGNDAASIAARAEIAAKRGDLADAVRELSTLDGPAAAAAKQWIDRAQARLTAERALSELTAKSAAALAARAG